ncbi:MAG: 23S rRNA (adenine(2503)-C(2))-methyltransferase RlmN [Bacteroidetes bacterium]|nr:MAG: 23S rRNA (adenine(2503)-C(2))-methyltransferase RlmN [Bacteroidota bacterium]
MEKKSNIRALSKAELQEQLLEMGEARFRAEQVYAWLWEKGVADFEEMNNISKSLRQQLSNRYTIDKARIQQAYTSKDGTVKYAFELSDGKLVEGVLIPTPKRLTACVSSQAGCSLSCRFCGTGYLPLLRNLQHYEIYDQVQLIRREAEARFGRSLTNIVYMGMGEPLLNYRNVLQSIEMITSPEGLGMSPRRITVSTAGIAKMIKRLADDEVKFEFALSLHAANDEKRSKIMPINAHNSLAALEEALRYFYEKTHSRVTYEYCIFRDVNDSLEDARELAEFCRIIPCKVNVIEYNAVEEAGFTNTSPARMRAFIDYLESRGIIVNVRRSRGKDIDGACGQLALRQQKYARSKNGGAHELAK